MDRTNDDRSWFGGSSTEPSSARTVVLVEGVSDRLAVEALAARHGRDLGAEGIAVMPMGGSKNIGRFLGRFGPQGLDVRVAGLCDAGEERDFQRGLDRAGMGSHLTRADMEALGFFVCVADLEDELIRSLGAAAVERVIDDQGELESFRTFQRQPQWRARAHEEQLRRFFGTFRGRKIRARARRCAGSLPRTSAVGPPAGCDLITRSGSRLSPVTE